MALRVNPDLPPKTHVKTDTSVKGVKFGLDIDTILDVARGVVGNPHVRIVGLHMHLGSPILSTQPYREGVAKGLALIEQLRQQGHPIGVLNMGGGFGIHYRKQEAQPADAFAEVIVPAVQQAKCRLVLEPGRFIVGNAGILVSRVIYTKESGGKHFIIQDAAMNDLIRPTLYDSFHRIWPVEPAAGLAGAAGGLRGRHPRDRQAGRGRPGVRVGRLPGQGPPPAAAGPRRSAGDLQRRRLRHGHEFQLQQPAARRRGAGGRGRPTG